ncbi:hypothetical protein [Portibacter marinus]|uniref:hypothetical protein n=1 Tax=Portibacter marinus TaxID=2898660 RepID=UPI001F478435|nr:hypothetical protein [Portibacter marinus]
MRNKILLLLLLFSQIALTQQSSSIFLKSGVAFNTLQDGSFSDLSYNGLNMYYAFSFNRELPRSEFQVEVAYINGQLKNPLKSDEVLIKSIDRNFINANISYRKKVCYKGLDLAIGLSNSTYYDLSTYPLPANNQVSYELTSSLNAFARLNILLTQHLNYRLTTNIPMVSASIRPLDGGLFHQKDMEFDLVGALNSANFYPTNKIFFLHFNHAIGIKWKDRPIEIYYDYFGGYNKVIDKKGSAVQTIGIAFPIYSNLKSHN